MEPIFSAIAFNICDETVELTKYTLPNVFCCSIIYMANKNPISLPVNCFHWPFVATATLNLSASGSLAITNLYPDSLAVLLPNQVHLFFGVRETNRWKCRIGERLLSYGFPLRTME